jgi:hypothetical protein
MTRLTSDERLAIVLAIEGNRDEIGRLARENERLQAMLAVQPDGSDGDTIRLLQPLCSCGLPLDHRHPITGEPRPCDGETERIAMPGETRTRPPVPTLSPVGGTVVIAGLVDVDRDWQPPCSGCGHAEAVHGATTRICLGLDCSCAGYNTRSGS